MFINIKRARVSYRIVAGNGIPAIYEASMFTVVSGTLDGYIIRQHNVQYHSDSYFTISLQELVTSKYAEQHIDGFFGYYFDCNDDRGIQELLRAIVADASAREGIDAPDNIVPY